MSPRATARALRAASSSSRAALVAASARAAALVASLTTLAACAAGTRQAPEPAPTPAPVAAAPTTPPAPTPAVIDSAVRAISERLLADSAEGVRPMLPEPRYALDVDMTPFESHDRVARYVSLFTGEGRERFAARLERGTRYDAMIRRRLHAAGLPEDLTYLALVESGYDPNAVSRASAVGMWQFMAGTARELGLRVDWWVDERRDPVKATDAAVRNLRWLRKEFGSLFLAAAAYNGGPGRVGRGLAQLAALSDSTVGEARFFALAEEGLLRTETVNYVPQIIAAALVAGEPERYGIAIKPLSPLAYDSAFVKPLTPLAAVAGAARATRDALLDLNPQLLRGMTPPGVETLVRLPAGAATGFATRLAEVPAAERRAFRGVRTKAGDKVALIADREEVPATEIRRFNPRLAVVKKGKRKGTLVVGQTLRIPTAAVLAYARPVGDVDGGGPSGLPAPVVAAAPVKREASAARAADDGGDVEADSPKSARPPKGAKADAARSGKAAAGKAAAKLASTGAGKSAAKGAPDGSAKLAVTSATNGGTKTGAKVAVKVAARGASRPALATAARLPAKSKPVAKGASRGASSSKSTAKASPKTTAKASTKSASTANPGGAKKGAETRKAAGKPAASSEIAKTAKTARSKVTKEAGAE